MSYPEAKKNRDAFVQMLDKEHRQFILAVCRAEGGINAESTNDVAQHVLETAAEQYDKHDFENNGVPKNLRSWLFKLTRNAAANHRRLFRPEIVDEAEVDAVVSPMPDPEGSADLAKRRERLTRYLEALPQNQKEVVLCIDLYEMTIEETANAVGCPEGTVSSRY